jgi:hypothetical protein
LTDNNDFLQPASAELIDWRAQVRQALAIIMAAPQGAPARATRERRT